MECLGKWQMGILSMGKVIFLDSLGSPKTVCVLKGSPSKNPWIKDIQGGGIFRMKDFHLPESQRVAERTFPRRNIFSGTL